MNTSIPSTTLFHGALGNKRDLPPGVNGIIAMKRTEDGERFIKVLLTHIQHILLLRVLCEGIGHYTDHATA